MKSFSSPIWSAAASLIALPLLVSTLCAQETVLPAAAPLPYDEPTSQAPGEIPYEAPVEATTPAAAPAKPPAPAKTPTPTPTPKPETKSPAKVSGGPLPGAASPTTVKTQPQENAVARRTTASPAAKPVVLRVAGITVPAGSQTAQIQFLQRALAPQLQKNVTLWDGQKAHNFTREDLGASIPYAQLLDAARKTKRDVPLRFVVDTKVAEATMKVLETRLHDQSAVQLVTDASRTPQPKVQLAVVGSALRVKQALEAQPPRSRVELVVSRPQIAQVSTQPTANPCPAMNGRHVLAEFSTPYDAGIRGRTANLKLAAQRINGKIVPVGGIFSANKAIGPRLEKDGWREAKMFVNGEIVSGTGAGICQASTTIYNAALLAGLQIVERHPHTFRVMYAPPSRDAAIYWGGKDFRFRNNTAGPIVLQTFLRGGRFHVKLLGAQPVANKIEVVSETLSRKNGTRSAAYRITRSAAGVQREKLSTDYYRPTPQ